MSAFLALRIVPLPGINFNIWENRAPGFIDNYNVHSTASMRLVFPDARNLVYIGVPF